MNSKEVIHSVKLTGIQVKILICRIIANTIRFGYQIRHLFGLEGMGLIIQMNRQTGKLQYPSCYKIQTMPENTHINDCHGCFFKRKGQFIENQLRAWNFGSIGFKIKINLGKILEPIKSNEYQLSCIRYFKELNKTEESIDS